jgi:hypothetical protein
MSSPTSSYPEKIASLPSMPGPCLLDQGGLHARSGGDPLCYVPVIVVIIREHSFRPFDHCHLNVCPPVGSIER